VQFDGQKNIISNTKEYLTPPAFPEIPGNEVNVKIVTNLGMHRP